MKTISKILALSLLLSFFVTIPTAQAQVSEPESVLLYETPSTPTSTTYLAYQSQSPRYGDSQPGQYVNFDKPQVITKLAFYVESAYGPGPGQPLVKNVRANAYSTFRMASGPKYYYGTSIKEAHVFDLDTSGYWLEFEFDAMRVPAGIVFFSFYIEDIHGSYQNPEDAAECKLTSTDYYYCTQYKRKHFGVELKAYTHPGSTYKDGPGQSFIDKRASPGSHYRDGDIMLKVWGRSQPEPPASWSTFTPPEEPSEVQLRTLGLSADNPGWGAAAAAQTVIKYHQNRSIDQCELVKLGRQDSNCEPTHGQLNELVESFYQTGIESVGHSPIGTLSLADIKEEIRNGRPIIAKLDNFISNGEHHPETYALINGYSETGVHFLLFPYREDGTAVYTNLGESVPYDKFVMMDNYTYVDNGETFSASWNWLGSMYGMTGNPIPSEDASEENYRSEDIAKMVWNDAPSLFMLTLTAMDKLGAGMQCLNPNPSVLKDDEVMLESLQAFWKMNALTNVVQYMPLPTTGIARSLPVEDALDALLPVWVVGFQGGIAESFTPGMGFDAALAGGIMFNGYYAGACNW